MLFGTTTPAADAARLIDTALDRGINSLDTANVYGRGASEEAVGAAPSRNGRRDRVVLASKVHARMDDDDPNAAGNSRRHVIDQCHATLRRLGVDHLDIYDVHRTWIPSGHVRLGRAGVPVNALAVAWLAFETVNIAWPRAVLAPPDAPAYQVWAAPIVLALITAVGLAYLAIAKPHRRLTSR